MKTGMEGSLSFVLVPVITIFTFVNGFTSDRILLTDTKVITLHYGKQTNSGRAHSIPQLKCVGGTAGCSAFTPNVIQCYNRGTDGYDVQWECKTDMDNAYRFGNIEVSCEGYDYPEDPYILKGSCGLEYTMDLTEEGHQKKGGNSNGYYSGNYQHSAYTPLRAKSSGLTDLIMLAVAGLVIYGIYRTCLGNTGTPDGYNDEYDTPSQGRASGYGTGYNPGSYGGSGYTNHRQNYNAGGCGSAYRSGGLNGGGMGTGLGGNNFWTGAATGGLLGYMFGSRNSGYGRQHYGGRSTWGGLGSGYQGSSWGSGGMASSSGTRTASGFATTKRR